MTILLKAIYRYDAITAAAVAKSLQSCLTLCDLHQAPPSLGFSRQEYWSGLPFPSPGDLPDPGIKPPALAGRFFSTGPPGKPPFISYMGL